MTYEEKHEKLRKDLWSPDDEHPVRVVSFFCKRKSNEPEITGKVFKAHETQFELVCDVSKVIALLNAKMRYKRSWKEHEVYDYGVLLDYLTYCQDGGYKKCLLSKKEWAILQPNKKK